MSSESMRGRLVEYQGMSWEVYGEGDRVSGERVVYLKNPVNDSVMVPLADVTLVQRQKSEGGRSSHEQQQHRGRGAAAGLEAAVMAVR